MITEIVSWHLTADMTREELVAKYRESMHLWQGRLNLRHKAYIFEPQTRRAGAVYLWSDIESAKKAHAPAFVERIFRTYGARPTFQYFETPLVIDNDGKQVLYEQT